MMSGRSEVMSGQIGCATCSTACLTRELMSGRSEVMSGQIGCVTCSTACLCDGWVCRSCALNDDPPSLAFALIYRTG